MATADSTAEIRDVAGFIGYRADTDGNLWSCWRSSRWGSRMSDEWRKMKPSVNAKGYLYLNLRRDGRSHTSKVHRIILETFVGPCPAGMECRHIDGNPANNRLDNLQWGTDAENKDDRKRHGHDYAGEDHPMVKLTEDQVGEIRALYATGRVLQRDIAERFGISLPNVSVIVNRKSWTHI
jgi:predicted XRE-type DNA-binding protein